MVRNDMVNKSDSPNLTDVLSLYRCKQIQLVAERLYKESCWWLNPKFLAEIPRNSGNSG
jgi:hypothetical protein